MPQVTLKRTAVTYDPRDGEEGLKRLLTDLRVWGDLSGRETDHTATYARALLASAPRSITVSVTLGGDL